MDGAGVTQLWTAIIAAAASVAATYLAMRGQSRQAKVEADGVVFGGYEKLVNALQGEIERLTERVGQMELRLRDQTVEIERLRTELAAAIQRLVAK